jgi:outer membrane immunogenic protein
MKRSLPATIGLVLLSAISAMSQEIRNEVSIQGTGFFTKDSDGIGISQQSTKSGGVLAGYRYHINRWFSAEANYGYTGNTQQYFSSAGASRIQAGVHATTADIVVNLPFSLAGKVTPYVLGGAGALVFCPTNNAGGFVMDADTQAKGTAVYGGGVDYSVLRYVSLRAEYRGFVYKVPDFGVSTLNPDTWTHTAQPLAGLVFRF